MITLEDAKKLMDDEINRSKRLLVIGSGIEAPVWLDATPEHSFGKEEHMVKLFVLEGSPPRGYILADYTYGLVRTLRGTDMKTIKTFKAYKKGETLGISQPKDDEKNISPKGDEKKSPKGEEQNEDEEQNDEE